MLPTRSQLYFVLFLCLFTVYYDTRLCPLGCLSYVLWRDHRFMGTTLIPLSSERKFGENCAAEVVVGCIYVASRPEESARINILAMLFFSLQHALWVLSWAWVVHSSDNNEQAVTDFFSNNGGSTHTNNWAVLVCASRYWFNYRVCLRSRYLF